MIEIKFTEEFFTDTPPNIISIVMKKLTSFPSFSMYNLGNGIIECHIEQEGVDITNIKPGSILFEQDTNENIGLTEVKVFLTIDNGSLVDKTLIGSTYISKPVQKDESN